MSGNDVKTVCFLLIALLSTSAHGQKAVTAPDFNQGQDQGQGQSPNQPNDPGQTPATPPSSRPDRSPSDSPNHPLPEPSLTPPGQERIEEPILPPVPTGVSLPEQEDLQLQSLTLLPPMSREQSELPPTAQTISDDAPDISMSDSESVQIEAQLEELLQRIETFDQSYAEIDQIDFDSLNESQLDDLFERMDRLERGMTEAFRDLVGFAINNFDVLDQSHFAGAGQRFGSPNQSARGSGNRAAPPTGWPSGGDFAAQGGPGHIGTMGPGGLGSWIENPGVTVTRERTGRRGNDTYAGGNNTTYEGTMPGGRFTGWVTYPREGGRRSTLHERFANGSTRRTVVTFLNNSTTQESHSEAPNGDRKYVWQGSSADQSGVTTETSEGVVGITKDGVEVTKRTETGVTTHPLTNPDTATNPGDDFTEGERAMAVWMWSRHNTGTDGGSRKVETGVRVNPGDRGESTGQTGAPSVTDVIDVDLVGDPREAAAGRLPENYREQTQTMARDGAGPGSNPGDPHAAQVEGAAPSH
ncbi:MAG: hypothetical protein ACFCU3_11645 [Verrucomicrobiales bacterium]